ncbi:MAG: COX15/CtaA family protein [Cytophagales bacterium]|nr:COX15/CtaA family protein [Cytophagales bacterium]
MVFYLRFLQGLLYLVFLLIFAGSWVRHTGSGMGCPDWPKCYGYWIPPSPEELPENYQHHYLSKKIQKTQKTIQLLQNIGLQTAAQKLAHYLNHQSIQSFNPLKAWTEYVNRLLGSLVGILFLLNTFFSFQLRKEKSALFSLSLWTLGSVCFQGILGAVVVFTHLFPLMVSIHMLLSLLLLYLMNKIKEVADPSRPINLSPFQKRLLNLSFIIFLIQILLGTQLRQYVDGLSLPITNWSSAPPSFYAHRSLPWILLLLTGTLVYHAWKYNRTSYRRLINLFFLLCLCTLIGLSIYIFHAPPFAQPLHLSFSLISFYAYLRIKSRDVCLSSQKE